MLATSRDDYLLYLELSNPSKAAWPTKILPLHSSNISLV